MKKNRKLIVSAVALTFLLTSQAGAQALPTAAAAPQATTPAPVATNQDATRSSDVLVTSAPKDDKKKTATPQGEKATKPPKPAPRGERLEPDDRSTTLPGVPVETQANRREQLSEEESAVVPYYNNFMSSYRLGPEDVISIRVFDQERYSMSNVTIPPDGRVSYWFVREGLMVTGKTTQQVSEEVTKHLDEYIHDPKVTVSLEKAMSARYGVIGDVAQPGIRVMTRRMSVYEALLESGGVLPTGDKKKVVVLHQEANGALKQTIIDVAAIEKGKALNNYYLAPGDQVVVPGNRLKKVQAILNYLPMLSFMRIFAGGL